MKDMPYSRLDITNTTKGRLPRLPFALFKYKILGEEYSLSLVFVSEAKSQALNKKHRGKDEPANILSFPLSKDEGEILISLEKTRKDAPSFNMPYRRFLFFIYLHGLLHLKGYSHSSKMEKKERQLLKESRV